MPENMMMDLVWEDDGGDRAKILKVASCAMNLNVGFRVDEGWWFKDGGGKCPSYVLDCSSLLSYSLDKRLDF